MKTSRGQAINLDWVTGLSLFMVAIISTTMVVVQDNSNSQDDLQKKAEEVSQELKEQAQLEARKTPLYIRGPNIGKLPVDKTYEFPGDAASAVMDIPSEINESEDSVITVVETGNRSYELTYFLEELDDLEYENDIDTGEWMNNSKISVLPSNTGLDSLRINSKEILDQSADFSSASDSITENQIYAEAGDLKLYNDSKELILESAEVDFYLKNFTDLYWGEDDTLYDLTGDGDIKQGTTSGLTLATYNGDDHGITFTGDLEADISKPDNDTIRANINASRLRIMLHDSDYTEGEKRINLYEDNGIYFGAENKVSGIYKDKTNSLNNMAEIGFENRFELRDHGYNITLLDVERGFMLPFRNIVSHNRKAAVIGREGNFSTTDIKVRLWN